MKARGPEREVLNGKNHEEGPNNDSGLCGDHRRLPKRQSVPRLPRHAHGFGNLLHVSMGNGTARKRRGPRRSPLSNDRKPQQVNPTRVPLPDSLYQSRTFYVKPFRSTAQRRQSDEHYSHPDYSNSPNRFFDHSTLHERELGGTDGKIC